MMAPASLKGSEHYPASLSLPNLGKTLRILLLSGGSSSQTMGITLTLAREMAICPNSGDQAACCPGVRSTRQHHPPFQDSDLAHSPGPRPPGVHPPGVHPPWGPPCLSSILPGVYPPWGPPSRGPFSLEPALLGPILPGVHPPWGPPSWVHPPGVHPPWGLPSWGPSYLGSILPGVHPPGVHPPWNLPSWGPSFLGPALLGSTFLGPILPGAHPHGAYPPWGLPSWGPTSLALVPLSAQGS